jgi:DNA-binding ferritin-like protein
MSAVYGCLTDNCSERLKGISDEPTHCSVCLQDLSPLSAHDEDLVSYSAKVRDLEAQNESLRAERDAAREALAFYADEDNYLTADARKAGRTPVSVDKGGRARAALTSTVPSEEGV